MNWCAKHSTGCIFYELKRRPITMINDEWNEHKWLFIAAEFVRISHHRLNKTNILIYVYARTLTLFCSQFGWHWIRLKFLLRFSCSNGRTNCDNDKVSINFSSILLYAATRSWLFFDASANKVKNQSYLVKIGWMDSNWLAILPEVQQRTQIFTKRKKRIAVHK